MIGEESSTQILTSHSEHLDLSVIQLGQLYMHGLVQVLYLKEAILTIVWSLRISLLVHCMLLVTPLRTGCQASRPMVSLASSRLRILHSPSKNLEVEIYSILVMDSPFVAEHTKRKELLKLVEMQMLHSSLTGSVVVLSKLMVLHLYLEPSDTKLLELYQHSTVRTKEELIRTTHLLLYHSGIWILELFHSRHTSILQATRHYRESVLSR